MTRKELMEQIYLTEDIVSNDPRRVTEVLLSVALCNQDTKVVEDVLRLYNQLRTIMDGTIIQYPGEL